MWRPTMPGIPSSPGYQSAAMDMPSEVLRVTAFGPSAAGPAGAARTPARGAAAAAAAARRSRRGRGLMGGILHLPLAEQAPLEEGDVGPVPHHHVVEDADAHELRHGAEAARDLDVLDGRRGIAAGVVV